MKMEAASNKNLAEIPKTIIQQFLAEFLRAGAPKHVHDRLKVVLLEKRAFTPEAIKRALSPEDET